MHPDLFDIGIIHIRTYGACMAIGFFLSVMVIERFYKKNHGRQDRTLNTLFLALMISGVIGSRIAYVIEHWKAEFAAEPLRVFEIWNGGLMFYGGLVLALIVFVYWCFHYKRNMLEMANLLAVAVPLGHACGRVGCFFYGCCYGKLSDLPVAVRFPRFSPAWHEQYMNGLISYKAQFALPVLPVQLFEAGALMLLFIFLYFVYVRFRRHTAGLYLMLYAVIRFQLEGFRGDPRAVIGPFSISQAISLAMFVLGWTILLLPMMLPAKNDEGEITA